MVLSSNERDDMRRKVPKRDWKRWGWAYRGHIALGGYAGYELRWGDVETAILITVIYLVYQYVEYLRRNDTPGRDVKDYAKGFVGVAVVSSIIAAGLRLWGVL